jgi:transposase
MLRLRDEHWTRIREHVPEAHIPESRSGRTPIPAREVLEAALWILNTGAQWHLVPPCSPNYHTVPRRVQHWCRSAVLRGLLVDLAHALREDGALDVTACFLDASFAPAQGGGAQSGLTKRGKGVKILAIVDRQGAAPLGQYPCSESS